MNFVFPGFLFALLAISIPIIIHLFRFRRFRTVYFPNIAFLQQLSEASDRESRLKQLLVLLARILAIACLVMAFARPYIPADDDDISPEGNAVSVYIDNSFSMNAMSDQGRSLDVARERALEIAHMYGHADRFLLLTNDFEGRHQRFVSREEFIDMAEQVDESPRTRTISEVMIRKAELFGDEPSQRQRAYYLSDYQKSTSGLEDIPPDVEPQAYFIPLQAQQTDNVYIDSLWTESPVILTGQPITMYVRLRNDGTQDMENQPLRVYVDGRQRSVVSYTIGHGEEETLELGWSAGSEPLQQAHVEIRDYPVTFDDRLYFTYQVSSEIPVLAIEGDGSNRYLRALFDGDELFNYSTMPAMAVDYSAFSDYQTIILDGFDRISAGMASEIQRFAEAGGSLVVFPRDGANLASYNDFLRLLNADTYESHDTTSMRVSSLNERHPVFDDVFEHIPEQLDLPGASQYFRINRQVGSMGEDILQLQNGKPFFASYPAGDGKLFLSAVPLDEAYSNFQRHSVFVPLMANIALQSGYMQALYHTIGADEAVVTPRRTSQTEQVFSLRKEGFEVIPEQRRSGNQMQLFFHDQIEEAGNYSLFYGDQQTGGVSFNYDRRESQLEAYGHDELEDKLANLQVEAIQVVDAAGKPLDQVLHEMSMGQQLWRLFLILALLFILVEVLLIRFWK